MLRATTNGTFLACSIPRLSFVCCWNPRLTSTTRTAMSAAEPPRERRFVKISCPGVSMTRIPGILVSDFSICLYSGPHISLIVSVGRKLAPMCWVIPPASLPWTPVPRILSSREVLPEST